MKKEPTLDIALDAFNYAPSAATAFTLVSVALEYNKDGMISDEEYESIKKKVAPYIRGDN